MKGRKLFSAPDPLNIFITSSSSSGSWSPSAPAVSPWSAWEIESAIALEVSETCDGLSRTSWAASEIHYLLNKKYNLKIKTFTSHLL